LILILREVNESRYLISNEKAEFINSQIKEILEKKDEVILDFGGIWIFSSDYMENLLQNLYFEYTKEYLNKNLKFIHVEKRFKKTLELMKENYHEYCNNPVHRGLLMSAYENFENEKDYDFNDILKEIPIQST
jgi:hypothetical protein